MFHSIQSISIYLLFLFTIFVCPMAIFAQSVEGYTTKKIQNYTVFISKTALDQNPKRTQEAVNLLEQKLQEINVMGIDRSILRILQSISFFVELNADDRSALYHPSKEWLVSNGYIPEKAGAIEISNIDNFINWTNLNQPYLILHELTHGFHHKALGASDKLIQKAYKSAISRGLYKRVLYNDGSGEKPWYNKSYAIENHHEYFAEITEAYFGQNDYFPFNKLDLQSYDPDGYRLLLKLWKIKQVSQRVSK
ncbi:hypothetical protein P3G55_15175 [Leptospira sp. 96542]|nr:hypothetical protein [Leptospira sp. 96542]